jgi:hypothetical protein
LETTKVVIAASRTLRIGTLLEAAPGLVAIPREAGEQNGGQSRQKFLNRFGANAV